jgi:hypothetical protein
MNTPKTCPTRPFERRCTQDCDQGRRCTCAPEATEELTIMDWALLAVAAGAIVAVMVFFVLFVIYMVGGVL